MYCISNSLQDHTTTTSQDKKQSKPQPDITKPFIDYDTGSMKAYSQCMIIDTHDGQHKDIIKAVPMEKAADTATITSDVRKDIEVIQGYIERDPLKQLYSIHEDSKYQKSKQFYLDSIENLFKKCMAIGGGTYVYACNLLFICDKLSVNCVFVI